MRRRSQTTSSPARRGDATDRQVDRGERQARRSDNRMDDDDEADSALCAAKIHDASLVPGFAATPPLHRDLRASQAA